MLMRNSNKGWKELGQRVKRFSCYIIIIVLLPYIITVFINGPSIMASTGVDDTCVNVKTENGKVEMPIEEYCIGILAREIPVNYEEEALKAQAVLVRTSIYNKIEQQGSDSVLEEEFWTREQMEEAWGITRYSKNYNRLKNIWEGTQGKVVMYEEKPARTPFFRLSNGSTRDGKEALGKEYPYIKIAECPLDMEAVEQMQTVTIDDMDAEVEKCDTAGYVLSVRVGDEVVSGEEFRKTYHLPSSSFTLQKYNGKLRITTRGVGHGVGMSQYTANEMAKKGAEAKEILEYFFPGTEVREVTQIVRRDAGV